MPSLDRIEAALAEALGDRAPEVIRYKRDSAAPVNYYLAGPSVEPLYAGSGGRMGEPRGVFVRVDGSAPLSQWVEAASATVAQADNVVARAALERAHGAHIADVENCPGCEQRAAEAARVAARDDWRVQRLIERAEQVAEALRRQAESVERAISEYANDPVARRGTTPTTTGEPAAVWMADLVLSALDSPNTRASGLAHAAMLAALAVEGSIDGD